MIDREFSITLDKMMRDKGVSTTELVKSTSLSKAYINRLRDPSRKNDKPKREVVIDIALGINAALDEANLLLKRARYQELYTRDKAESVIIWGMLKKLSGAEIRELLAEKGLLDTIFPEKKRKSLVRHVRMRVYMVFFRLWREIRTLTKIHTIQR